MRFSTILASVSLLALLATPTQAAEEAKHPKDIEWSFDGIFGTVDRQSAQRGFQVYREVCASCHGAHRIAFRSLEGLGFSEEELKALAAEYTVMDGPNDDGDMFERPGRPADRLPAPYANEQAARAANGGAYPPDLSLMVKARHDGANYVYSLLTGYEDAPEDVDIPEGKYYNAYFPGGAISMPPPINSAGQVQYADGTEASIDQMSRDVVNFLQWTAEPEMEVRKQMGIKAMIFLAIMTAFFYVAKRRVWRKLGGDHSHQSVENTTGKNY